MTVNELREMLSQFDGEEEIYLQTGDLNDIYRGYKPARRIDHSYVVENHCDGNLNATYLTIS